jgi:hypothetical protein
MELSGQLHTPAGLSPGNKPSTHPIGEWVGSRNRLNEFAKINISCRILLRTVVPKIDGIMNTRVNVSHTTSQFISLSSGRVTGFKISLCLSVCLFSIRCKDIKATELPIMYSAFNILQSINDFYYCTVC